MSKRTDAMKRRAQQMAKKNLAKAKVRLARVTLLTVACGAGVEARSLGCAIAGVATATAAMAAASRIACMMSPFD